jgi:hypothetical protein
MALVRTGSFLQASIPSLGLAVLLVAQGLFPGLASAQNQVWVEQIGTTDLDDCNAAAPGPSGGVYFGGSTEGDLGGPNAGSDDAWVGRWDSAGNQLWIRQFGLATNDGVGDALPGPSDGVFVCGGTQGNLGGTWAGGGDAWVALYDSAGSQVWITQFGTAGNESAGDLAHDSAGGFFVSGSTSSDLGGPNAGSSDIWVARYDASGVQVWIRQFGSAATDGVFATAPDAAGGVYLCGRTLGDLGGPAQAGQDAWLARYDGAGNQLWVRHLGSLGDDQGTGVEPDGSGGVYFSGFTDKVLGVSSAGGFDAWVARYDSAGNQQWIRQFGTNLTDRVRASAHDPAGGVFVCGETEGSLGGSYLGLGDPWVARYDSLGNQVWVAQFGSDSFDFIGCASEDGAGGIVLGGFTWGDLGGPHAGGLSDAWFARYEGSCGQSIAAYCTASATSIPGCQAAINSTGSPSLAAPSGFSILSGAVPGGTPGICFFGTNGPASIPFGTLGGKICVQPPLTRSPGKFGGGNSGVCNGQFVFTLQDLLQVKPGITPGTKICVEIWARDPANPDGSMLSNGLQFITCP